MKQLRTLGAAMAICAIVAGVGHRAPLAQGAAGAADYIVLLEDGTNPHAALTTITAAGGVVTSESTALGAFTVSAPQSGFMSAMASVPGIVGAAKNQSIGRTPEQTVAAAHANRPENERRSRLAALLLAWVQAWLPSRPARLDPMDATQWNLKMVKSDLARTVQAGRSQVLVGILDSGVDYTHPDLIQNYDFLRARNFVTDIPIDANGEELDGPCEAPGCQDPVGRDDLGTGTFMAGVVGASANGFGLSGVAPRVTLVDIRITQDAGLVFLQPFLDGLTYAADSGVDVATLGFSLDPWLYNCPDNQADSPEHRAQQRTTIIAVERALTYAHAKGVTLIGSMGNGHQDLGKTNSDAQSPTFADAPGSNPYQRTIEPGSCAQLPVEGPYVIGVSALGPSEAKADYANYGIEHTSVSAPGGFFRDFFGTPQTHRNANFVLSTAPRSALLAKGLIDANDNITDAGQGVGGVVKYCGPTRCAFYQGQQSSSWAAGHAAGVAALIVSQYGQRDGLFGWRMSPDKVERVLLNTASERPCPDPPLHSYANVGRPLEYDALCEGDASVNGFYGHGIVDAYRAVTQGAAWAR